MASAHRPTRVQAAALDMACGGMAGLAAKTAEAPVDRMKVLFQTGPDAFTWRSGAQVMGEVVRREGWRGLWKGNVVAAARQVPFAGINYAAREAIKTAMIERRPEGRERIAGGNLTLSPWEKLASGACSGAASTMLTYPLEVARVRMQAARPGAKVDLRAIFEEMYRSMRGDAQARVPMAGLGPTLLGMMAYAGVTWTVFETLQERRARALGTDPRETNPMQNAMYGGAAGLVGQTVVYPIETVRRRIQVMKRQALHAREGELVVATNATRVFFRVWKEEGTRGLYKGLSINFVKGPLALATSFTVFHWTKNAISDRGTRGSGT